MEQELKELRRQIFLTGYSVNIAHIASAFSIVEILYSLYINHNLKYDSKNYIQFFVKQVFLIKNF